MFTQIQLDALQSDVLRMKNYILNNSTCQISFSFQSQTHQILSMTFQIKSSQQVISISFTTNSLTEEIILAASQVAQNLKFFLESDPVYRLRIVTGGLRIEFGKYLVQHLSQYHEKAAPLQSHSMILSAYEAALPVYKINSNLSIFSIVSIGEKGKQLAQSLKELGFANFSPSDTGIYQIYLYNKNGYKPFLEELIFRFTQIGFPCWLAYNWDKLG